MRIEIITTAPIALKKAIIKNVEDGEFRTWKIEVDNDKNKLLNHTAAQYIDKVLIDLTSVAGKLIAETTFWDYMGEPDDAVKAVIMGNFTGLLLTYFTDDFSHLETFHS
ncbi:hypothetical protein [Flavobacterium sp. AG291]|uniref:hypothetical protein n=1 Tax=Flavobacterium sp. AG291 TaxID=2184000 RepID=UPI000E0BFA3E|nr:hypothetical protein [Flavobacterium sp. AG291]RDI13208.1 hypothetical protein DEU42_103118 [Flavobacterium sp. AG291]